MLIKKKRVNEASIPTASMADIAFLLLIFFLVATVIDVDTGIGMTLPEYSEDPPPPASKERMASVLVNENSQILIDGKSVLISQISEILIPRINSKIDLPKNKKLIVSLKTDRNTRYGIYIAVLDQIKLAFFESRDEYSNSIFGNDFNNLDSEEQKVVTDAIPIIISLAEPEQVK